LQILIVGGGLVGSTLARRLSNSGRDVVIVERDAVLARRLRTRLDVQVIEGNGTLAGVLRDAGIERSDVVLATTERDETNMVVGMLAAKRFEVPRLLVRLRDPGHEEGFSWLARDRESQYVRVNPDAAAVDRIMGLLAVPGALDVAPFMDDALLVAGFRIQAGSDLAGLTVSHMSLFFAGAATLVAAIQRGPDWIVPHGAEELREGDIAYFSIARHQIEQVSALVRGERDAPRASRRRRVLIAGATRIGLDLARRLESREARATLIEEDPEQARLAAEALPGTLVVEGRSTDEVLLDEEGIEHCSTFVAVTPRYENNLVAGLMAKRLGADQAYALVDNPDLVHLIGDVAIDAVISPRLLAVSLALQHIRGGKVRSVAALLEEQIEVVEAEAGEKSPLVRRKLAELGLPRGVLVAALSRAGEILVPQGQDRIEPGDRVLVVATTAEVARVAEQLCA